MKIRSADVAGKLGESVEMKHHPRCKLGDSKMRTYRAEDIGSLESVLKKQAKNAVMMTWKN
jgi:hypothetical protein